MNIGRRMYPRILSCIKVRIALVTIVLSRSRSIFLEAATTRRSGIIDNMRNGVEIGITPAAVSFEATIAFVLIVLAWHKDGKVVVTARAIRDTTFRKFRSLDE